MPIKLRSTVKEGKKMKDITVREANTRDAKAILDINISSWKETYKNIFPSEFLDNLCSTEEEYNTALNNVKENIKDHIVAKYNNKVVGFIKLGQSKKEVYSECGEIYALYVDNEYIKKGIGKMLFNSAKSQLKEKYNSIIVSCIKENTSNDFYLKMGCKKIGETDFILNNKKYKENLYEVK